MCYKASDLPLIPKYRPPKKSNSKSGASIPRRHFKLQDYERILIKFINYNCAEHQETVVRREIPAVPRMYGKS